MDSQFQMPSTPAVNVGENWYVKIGECLTLSAVYVRDVTFSTVELVRWRDGYVADMPINRNRYLKSDVQFIEKINK